MAQLLERFQQLNLCSKVVRISRRLYVQASGARATTGMEADGRRLKLNLFSHIQGVVHLNPEISDRAFQFGMTEEKLDRM
jgi:hypothetical protein